MMVLAFWIASVKSRVCRRADIEAHPALRDLLGRHDLGLRAVVHVLGDHEVHGKIELDVALAQAFAGALGHLEHLGLHEGVADFVAPGLAEGEGHGAAHDDLVHLVLEVLDHADLARHLGPAEDGHEGPHGIGNGLLEIFDLLLHEETGDGDLYVLGDAVGGGVGAVGRAEGVVHVDIGERRKGLGEPLVVLLLLGVEPEVLEQQHVAGPHALHQMLHVRADAVLGELHLLVQEAVQAAWPPAPG